MAEASPGAPRYDAFISYSHAKDRPLARAVQAVAQGLGKVWYQRRALRLFRDESSLAATPELWPSIVTAMNNSRFFVLLASPEAAQSPWVDKEVDHWLRTKGSSSLLVAITEGDVYWHAGDFAWRGARPLPPALEHAFASEPKWVDLRAWRHAARQQIERDPDFKDRVADLAAAIHGKPKEDLLSAELREQKRRLTHAYIALALVAGLGVLAGSLAYYASVQRATAVAQRDQALLAQSNLMASTAQRETADGDATAGMLVALEALPDRDHDVARPLSAAAELSLYGAYHSRRELQVLAGHRGPVNRAVFGPDGRYVLTVGDDFTARLWDSTDGYRARELTGHEKQIWAAAFSPDGTRLVTGAFDETLRLHDVPSGNLVRVLRGHTGGISSAAFSGDGRWIVSAAIERIARVWSVTSDIPPTVLADHEDVVKAAVFSPDGRTVLTAAGRSLYLWQAADGRLLWSRAIHSARITGAVFDKRGGHILSWSEDKTAVLWSVAEARVAARFEPHGQPVSAAAISPDGAWVATGAEDGIVQVWRVAASAPPIPVFAHREGAVTSLAFTPDGGMVVSAGADGNLAVAVPGQGKDASWQLRGHYRRIHGLSLSSDGRRVVTAGEDGTARVWSIGPLASTYVVEPERKAAGAREGAALAFSPAGTSIAYAGGADGEIVIRDVASPIQQRRIATAAGPIVSLGYDGRGERLVSAHASGAVLVTALAGGPPRELGAPVGRAHASMATQAAFSGDGARVVSASSDGSIKVWDASTGKLVEEKMQRGEVASVALSEDGTVAAAGLFDRTANADVAIVWTIGSAGEPWPTPQWEHKSSVNTVALSRDGRRLLTGSSDSLVRLWRVSDDKPLVLAGHDSSASVLSVGFAAALGVDGSLHPEQRVFSAASDRVVRLWRADTGEPLAVLTGASATIHVAGVAADGRWAAAVAGNGEVRVWHLFRDTQELVRRAKAEVGRCLGVRDRTRLSLPRGIPEWCGKSGKWAEPAVDTGPAAGARAK